MYPGSYSFSKLRLLLVLCFALFVALISRGNSAAGPTALTVTAPGPGGVTLAELDEFATNIMFDPWDMNQHTDLAFYRTESQMTGASFANGLFSATMGAGNGGERITLLTAGAASNAALRMGKIGYTYPIDATRYRHLTFRVFKGNGDNNQGLIQWYADDTYTSTVMGVTNAYDIFGAGWHIISVDLATIGIQLGSRNWVGTIRELIIHPFAGAGAGGATVRLDWARLTAENPLTARPYTIQWNGGSGSVTLYASPNNTSLGDDDDMVIATGQSSSGSYTYQTGVLPPGTYNIAAVDGSTTAWGAGPIVINTPPQTTITKPSKTSGEEYSLGILGNAWDMNDTNDLNDVLPVDWETCVTNEIFSGGVYRADLDPCSTDILFTDTRFILGHMNPPGPDPPIDTSKFRYYSFRYRLSGEQNVGEGWVARVGWWRDESGLTTEATVMSRDIMLMEQWNTYKVDLWAADIIDEAHPVKRAWTASAPNRLRLDPTELFLSRFPATVQIDWVMLTAMDEVNAGALFPIEFTVDSSDPATLSFFYDTDTNPGNGRTFIGTTTALMTMDATPDVAPVPSPPQATTFAYLPVVMKGFVDCSGPNCFAWDTSGVPTGTYYICVDTADALDATYRCSEAPLIVR